MSVDMARVYLFPADRLQAAVDAFAAVGRRRKTPATKVHEFEGLGPLTVPFILDDYQLRMAVDEGLDRRLAGLREDGVVIKKARSGGRYALLHMEVGLEVEAPYAAVHFRAVNSAGFNLLAGETPARTNLDYAGRRADRLAVYVEGMGEFLLVEPFEGRLDPEDRGGSGEGWTLPRIAAYVERRIRELP
ncbi:hypothetical protein [Novosphingobium sp.]|uniref:hypothetical protein n=1 Tax=Novosphingobium sp. TaxID=1874826 RepID=UPI003D09C81A